MGYSSILWPLICGVLQGSLLPLPYPMGLEHSVINLLCLLFPSGTKETKVLNQSLAAGKDLMQSNKLNLNLGKIEVLLVGKLILGWVHSLFLLGLHAS